MRVEAVVERHAPSWVGRSDVDRLDSRHYAARGSSPVTEGDRVLGANGDIVRRLISEAWSGQDLHLVDEDVAEDYLEHAPFGLVEGREGYREGVAMFSGAFAPVELDVHDVIEQGERVAARFTFRGRHTGEFLGVPPSGADVVVEGITIVRLEAGQVAEEWLATDLFGLMQQIGAIPQGD
jgi:steroid delta-isomerase-like uncharacterized protein